MNTSSRNQRTGGQVPPVRAFSQLRGLAGALALAAAPLSLAIAAPASADTAVVAADPVAQFYRSRSQQPLWLLPQSGAAAQQLLSLLDDAQADGLDPKRYQTKAIAKALRAAWGGSPQAVQRAEMLLSQAYVAYANDLRRAPSIGVYYVDSQLAPHAESPATLLRAAASAPSLQQFVSGMGWMNPIYGQLRTALATGQYGSDAQRQLLALNLERARQLPWGTRKYIIVNAAAQRLYMYEGGKVVDTMRVVVGKPKYPTPMMSALIRFASLNPYWYVPPDLAAERIAPNVVKEGLRYLKTHGYQVMSDWSENPSIVDPSTIDWKSVADGTVEVAVRQLPGPGNSMGQMKFMFPNREGVYLHDTPDKQLLTEASRLFSGGCVRLEDAPRLGEWMFGTKLKPAGANPEQNVPLDNPVQVYITYLTAEPNGSSIAWFDDIYGRDAARLAIGGGNLLAAR
ncbi:MAG: L,D-transpeptidase family protein [Sphingomicrobium sp.]